jgi:CRISPR/Cas system-associated protein endoribonuclease Cas2
VDYVEKWINLQKQNVAVSGFVMMQTSMFSSLMLETVAIETTTGTHFVRIIIMKDIRVIGRNVKKGDWKECQKCRKDFETEMYVWYGTNEYNFEKLANPPKYEPTKCAKCRKIIKLGEDGYSLIRGQYLCEKCGGLEL